MPCEGNWVASPRLLMSTYNNVDIVARLVSSPLQLKPIEKKTKLTSGVYYIKKSDNIFYQLTDQLSYRNPLGPEHNIFLMVTTILENLSAICHSYGIISNSNKHSLEGDYGLITLLFPRISTAL